MVLHNIELVEARWDLKKTENNMEVREGYHNLGCNCSIAIKFSSFLGAFVMYHMRWLSFKPYYLWALVVVVYHWDC